MASLLDCNEKNWKVLDLRFLVGDVTIGIGLTQFRFRLPGLRFKQLDGIFDSSFYWKLGYSLSLLNP